MTSVLPTLSTSDTLVTSVPTDLTAVKLVPTTLLKVTLITSVSLTDLTAVKSV